MKPQSEPTPAGAEPLPGKPAPFSRLKAPVFRYKYPRDFPNAEQIAIKRALQGANKQLTETVVASYGQRREARTTWFWALVTACAKAIGRVAVNQKWGTNRTEEMLKHFARQASYAIKIAAKPMHFEELMECDEWRTLDDLLFPLETQTAASATSAASPAPRGRPPETKMRETVRDVVKPYGSKWSKRDNLTEIACELDSRAGKDPALKAPPKGIATFLDMADTDHDRFRSHLRTYVIPGAKRSKTRRC